jgi:hypothetical protein
MSPPEILQALRALLEGEVCAIDELRAQPWPQVVAVAKTSRMELTKTALLRAMTSWREGRLTDTEINNWAFFIWRGYSPGSSGPIQTIEIQRVDEVNEILVRLTELGEN